ncbi:TonB-dependent receptor plug domain-containing protein [Methylobacillus sp.]|uniref:TonB-dependent receptor n=1 Tax=Methylobacillus sp. TaxID=56818 RepID=UPI002580F833|nr:TonB-dependent receptor plug domain-containing protein [Methylobacillus sp.]
MQKKRLPQFKRSLGFIAMNTLLGLYSANLLAAENTNKTNPENSALESEANVLGHVVVQAGKLDNNPLPSRPSSSVYGTDTSILDIPRSVFEITKEQLTRDPIRNADDLVRYGPSIQRNGGQNVNIAPVIRGQASEIFQDGQRTYNVRRPFNINAYEGADIVTGPAPQIYGPSSRSGGYINYLSKRPDFDKQRSEITGVLGTWVPSGGSFRTARITYDTTGPISDTLAYRVSITPQRTNDYYDNVSNNFNAFYGALAWKPQENVRVDWNASYDDYYDFNIIHGWNRGTQQLVDHGLYNAGRATPIIQQGNNFYSPIYDSGAANSNIIGWQERIRNASGQMVPGANVAPPFNDPNNPGTIRGWVYDPSTPGNVLKKLSRSDFSRKEDKNTAKRGVSQLRIAIDLSPEWSILNSTMYQYSDDTNDSVGSFLTQFTDKIFDNRTEFRGRHEFNLFGLQVSDKSNTGVSFRRESFRTLAANNSFTTSPYDLTAPLYLKTPGGLLGLPTYGSSGSWIGQPGVPQLSSFGYLVLPRMYPVSGGLYAEPGGFPANGGGAVYTGEGRWTTSSLYTQQNFLINEKYGFNIGLNTSYIDARIKNPLIINPVTDDRSDSYSVWLPSLQTGVLYKPTIFTTLYANYDRSYALNTGGFADVLTWGRGNQLDPNAFRSLSILREIGIKSELIPNKLFVTLSGYRQERDTSPDNLGQMARFIVKGMETSIRFQATDRLSGGANASRTDARFSYLAYPGGFFSAAGFVPDNATVFGDGNFFSRLPNPGEIRAPGIPKYSVNGFLDYRLPSGLGATLAAWWTSSWYTNPAEDVKIPNNYNFDLTLYYNQPKYDLGLRILNLTNRKNFSTGGVGGTTGEFIVPSHPLSVQATFAYRF